MKPVTIFVLVLILQSVCLGRSSAAATVAACSVRTIDGRNAEVRAHGRVIRLIGWGHLDDATGNLLTNGLKSAFELAKNDRCDDARKTVDEVLSRTTVELEGARGVIELLQHVRRTGHLMSIGIEMSQYEFDEQLKLNVNLDRAFEVLESRCGLGPSTSTANLRLMVPGPEFEFARSNKSVVLRPLEDQKLKDANELDFAGEADDVFDFKNPNLGVDGRAALAVLEQNILDQVEPADGMIERVVSFERDPSLRAKLRTELQFSIRRAMRIIKGANARNVAIAANILGTTEHIAVPIGYKHVPNLAAELIKQCSSR